MSQDEMSAEEFGELFQRGKTIAERMIHAGGKNAMQDMAMAAAIFLAEFANQNSADPEGQRKVIQDISNSAVMVLDWARASTPKGGVQ